MNPVDLAIQQGCAVAIKTQEHFADVEIRPGRNADGGGVIRAYVGGKYVGDVITDPDGAVLIRVAGRAMKRPVVRDEKPVWTGSGIRT